METDPFGTTGLDEQEEDVCRVCRLEAEDDNPMVHPCKCSGSVRFVHPDCLKSWLATSQKKSCEICGHRYTFTKVYPDHIPDTIPPDVYIRQVFRYLFSWVLYIYRCWIVMAVWLIVLPMANMGGLKGFGWFVDFSIGGLLPSLQAPNATSTINATLQEIFNSTTHDITAEPSSDVLDVVLTTKLGPGLTIRIAKRLWRLYRGTPAPNITIIPTPPPAPQIRSFLLFRLFDAPTPYYIFQGQMLSIALAATIVSLIFVREWYASYNWAQHDKTATPPVDENVVAEEWVIRKGIAERRYTKLPNGKLIPISRKRKRRPKWEDLAKPMTGDAEWTDEEGGDDEEETVPLPPHIAAMIASLPSPSKESSGATDGPGPSTQAFRAIASRAGASEAGDEIHTDEQLSADIERIKALIERAEVVRKARAKLAVGRTDSVVWKAPELLEESRKGKERAVEGTASLSLEEDAPNEGKEEVEVVEGEANGEKQMGDIEEDAVQPELKEEQHAPPASANGVPDPFEYTPAPSKNEEDAESDSDLPPLEDIPAPTTSAPSSIPQSSPSPAPPSLSDPGSIAIDPRIIANMTRSHALAPLARLVSQLSSDLQVLSDRRAALQQDADLLVDLKPQPGESAQYILSEIGVFKERMKETEDETKRASERLAVVMGLTVKFGDLASEIEELLEKDKSGAAGAGAEEANDMASDALKGEDEEEIGEAGGEKDAETEVTPSPPQHDGASRSAGPSSPTLPPVAEPKRPLFSSPSLPWDRPDRLPTPDAGSSAPEASTASAQALVNQAVLPASAAADIPIPPAEPSTSTPPANQPASDVASSSTQPAVLLPAPDAHARLLETLHIRDNRNVELPPLLTGKIGGGRPEDAGEELEQIRRWYETQGVDIFEMKTEEDFAREAAAEEPEVEVPAVHEDRAVVGEVQDGLAALAAAGDAGVDSEGSEVGEPAIPEDVQVVVRPVDEEAEEGPADDADMVDILFEDEDEDEGGWAADDWDQILEVIGLVGPYSALIQNLVLAIAIMGAAMSTCILFPMTIGKIFLCTDPIRTLLRIGSVTWSISRKLLRWTRYLTDPIIDIVVEIARDVVFRPLGKVVGIKPSTPALKAVPSVGLVTKAKNAVSLALFAYEARLDAPYRTRTFTLPRFLVDRSTYIPETITLNNAYGAIRPSAVVNALEKLGNRSYNAYEAYRALSLRIATRETLGDAVTCLAIGYGVGLVLLTAVAWMGEHGELKVSERWKASLRRVRLSIKLTMFLALELIAFPLGAGALIALCTIPIFPSIPLKERLAGMKEIAFGMVFITWLIGTMFMYGFAQVLAWCRSYCRPGALYFIRDPHDPKYSPVKEIINRSTTSQFHKLGVSTIMYGFLIWWVFGAVPWGMKYLAPGTILPLRLDKFGPISPIPYDYLFLLIAVPPTIRRIRPQHTLKKLLCVYWRLFERLLRLQHLLYADKSSSRPVPPPTITGRTETIIWNILDYPFVFLFGKYDSGATLARVPAQDRVHLLSTRTKDRGVRREGMFVLLTERGQPKTPNDKVKMIRQDLIARKAERDPAEDFKIVHLPEKWRTRIHVFILALLAGGGAFLGMFILCPIVLGREILKGWFGEVHDGYSFLVGAYTIYAAILAGRRAYRITVSLNRARQRRLASRQLLVKRFILSNLRRALILAVVYIVHPILRGLIWELRLGLLVRYGMKEAVPVIHLWDAWALGSVLNSIELGACGLFGRHRGDDAHLMHHLWRKPFAHGLRQLVLILRPEFQSQLINLALPFLYSACVIPMWSKKESLVQLHFRMAGLTTWGMRAMVVRIPTLGSRWAAWRQTVIDAEYVVEERVENYEPEPEVEVANVEEAKKSADKVHENGVDDGQDKGEGEQETVLDDGGVLLVPVEDEAIGSETDEEEVEGAGTGEASEVDIE